jgi:hypothetical protein
VARSTDEDRGEGIAIEVDIVLHDTRRAHHEHGLKRRRVRVGNGDRREIDDQQGGCGEQGARYRQQEGAQSRSNDSGADMIGGRRSWQRV